MRYQQESESIGDLARRLVADGKAYAVAEVEIYKQKGLAWVPPVRTAAVLLVVALFLVQAAVTTLLVGIGFWLAFWLGPLGGTVAAAVIALLIAGLLAYLAIRQFSTAPGEKP